MNPPVDFAHLSTGENGDSEAELMASKADPWVPAEIVDVGDGVCCFAAIGGFRALGGIPSSW
jgi:hypothetical protein